ncbi:ATP-binding protein [Roseibium sp. HPY-6]|uniref:sensor histidine kinase n=1 Tax=Roseibium sp. HPY-6 TaxID=3229852 RepID=UPI00338EDE61
MMHRSEDADPGFEFSDNAWTKVLEAVDQTYSELVAYQEQLEEKNSQLEELRRFLSSVMSSVSDVLVVIDRGHMIEQTGGSFDRLVHGTSKTWSGKSFDDLVHPDSLHIFRETIERAISTHERAMVEIDIVTADGASPLELSIAPRLNERGKSVGAVIVGRPLGELRRAYSELESSHATLKETQAQLVRNEKMAGLGRLVAGVAHELNNPISFVYANTHALEKSATKLETYFNAVTEGAPREDLIALRQELRLDRAVANLRTAITGAKDGAERVRDIVEDLRRLSADGGGDLVDFDLVTTTRLAVDWVARGTKTPVSIVFEEGDAPVAYGNPGHVQQIVMNLVQNAIDALSETVDPEITLTHRIEGDWAVLAVCDNGPGIPKDIQPSVFDPFFTTKPVGEGTGLGLSISHKIAQEHGGDLTLCSSGDRGSCFCLKLQRKPNS